MPLRSVFRSRARYQGEQRSTFLMAKPRKCPQCGAQARWDEDPRGPFCSARRKMADLGAWLGEDYVIEGENVDPDLVRPPDEELH